MVSKEEVMKRHRSLAAGPPALTLRRARFTSTIWVHKVCALSISTFLKKGKVMKRIKISTILVLVFGLMIFIAQVGRAETMGTAFTYQGRLIDANKTTDGLYDFQFKLYDAVSEGNQVGADVNKLEVNVIDGYFTVSIDFGSDVFNGDARWLEIGVRPGDQNDPNVYTTLIPRQQITATPFALYAKTAGGGTPDSDWIISGNNMYSGVSGKVGIGTVSPEKKLDIASDSYTDLGICLRRDLPGGTSWDIDNDEGVFKIVEHASCGPDFINNTRIAVVGNCIGSPYGGNVGIGTEYPKERLDVNGPINTCSVYKIGTDTVLSALDWHNIFVGFGAGANNTAGYGTFVGYNAGYSNTSGPSNTFVGCSAGYSNTTGLRNIFVGELAGYFNTTGHSNTFSGYCAGAFNTTGNENTFSGYQAGYSNTEGGSNTFLGNFAGYSNTTGSLNTFSGYKAGFSNNTGSCNTFLGDYAGLMNTAGNDNTFSGYEVGYNNTGSGNVFIGCLAGYMKQVRTSYT